MTSSPSPAGTPASSSSGSPSGSPASSPSAALSKTPSDPGHGAAQLCLLAAPFTVFADDASVRVEAIARQADGLRADGVSGAFVCGTTGEGASLTVRERTDVAATWSKAAEGLRLIVHVGHACLADARALAEHAAEVGAAAVAAVPPYYHRPASVEDLVTCCRDIAGAAADTPFFYYHIPAVTGVWLSMTEFFERAVERIPNFAGVKYTHDDLGEFARLVELAGDDREVMFGTDELLLPALTLGARTAVGSTYNFAAPLYLAMAEAAHSGDLTGARERQRVATTMVETAGAYGGPPALKAIAARLNRAEGPCRWPLATLSTEQADRLWSELDTHGFPAALDAARAS